MAKERHLGGPRGAERHHRDGVKLHAQPVVLQFELALANFAVRASAILNIVEIAFDRIDVARDAD